MAPSPPDVTVVVIVHNDAARLPAAVASVLDQSLAGVEAVVVDDASTDGSGDVARALAAEHPGRVRAVVLPENSGGCGRPRNVGVRHARGAHVMFLDSDDTLDRHACRNMLEAAERTGADVVSGRCVRVFLDGRTGAAKGERAWMPWLYKETAVYRTLADKPELLFDTLSTNKCYRRGFLEEHDLRFREDLHYEDLLFSATVYLAARRIALIPHRVYNWNVAVGGGAPSISNRRGELANVEDRLAIHRQIDALLAAHGDPDLKTAKDVKFLKHDLKLYMSEYALRDAAYRKGFRALLAGYLPALDPAAADRVDPFLRMAAHLVTADDDAALLTVSERIGGKGRIASPLSLRNGRVYWCDRHLDTPEGRRVLDVTSLGLDTRPLASMKLAAHVTGHRAERGAQPAELRGRVVNPLGRIPRGELPGHLEFTSRADAAHTFTVPVRASANRTEVAWTAEFPPAPRTLPIGVRDTLWNVRLHLAAGGTDLVCPVLVPAGTAIDLKVPVRPAFALFTTTWLRAYAT
ncbi:glycosyltransferase family 2 protein, partial [Actinomadura parmotrematis]